VPKTLPLKKLVIELRYKPELGFYGKMDTVGLNLSEKLPDWERSPLTVEVRNKKKHRRVFLSHRRCFYETDLDRAETALEFEFAATTLQEVYGGLAIGQFKRVGVRQWFAADLKKPFALMVDHIATRFLNEGDELSSILTDGKHDVAYAVDYETSEGWKYHLRIGPMTKEQWLHAVNYEASIFESPEGEDARTFEKYRDCLPENFLYLDIDCFQEDVAEERFTGLVTAFRRRSHDLAGRLILYCQE
jgi:hypothetical protein